MEKDLFNSVEGIGGINWAEYWQKQVNHTYKTQSQDYWDSWAKKVKPKKVHSGYVNVLLPLLNISKDDTVIDVGSGTGALSLPLARTAKKVYAFDMSKASLDIVIERAKQEGLDNIEPLQGDWNQVDPQKLPQCDIAIASRSLPGGKDIARSIWAMNEAADLACYITWRVRGHDQLDRDISEIIGIDIDYSPEHAILYNVIESMGIHPNVTTFTIAHEREYESLEDAYFQIVRSREVNSENAQKVMQLLDEKLTHRDDRLYYMKETTWVLFGWEKSPRVYLNPEIVPDPGIYPPPGNDEDIEF